MSYKPYLLILSNLRRSTVEILDSFHGSIHGLSVIEGATVKTWTKTRVQNLMRHRNGLYYARFYSKGKEHWVPLKTELFEVAKARLREQVGELREETAVSDALVSGKMTFGEAAKIFLERLRSSGLGLQGKRSNRKRITESSIHYREQTVKVTRPTFPSHRES